MAPTELPNCLYRGIYSKGLMHLNGRIDVLPGRFLDHVVLFTGLRNYLTVELARKA